MPAFPYLFKNKSTALSMRLLLVVSADEKLVPALGVESRLVNLSSAAQAAVDLDALRGNRLSKARA